MASLCLKKKTQSGQQSEESCVWRLAPDSWVSRRKRKFRTSQDLETHKSRTAGMWMGPKSGLAWGKAFGLTQPEECPSQTQQWTAPGFMLWRGWTKCLWPQRRQERGDRLSEEKKTRWKLTCPFPSFEFPDIGIQAYSPTQAGDWRFLTGETVLPLFLFILFLNHSKLNNSVAVHTFTILYNQHFYLISKHFITPKVNPFASLLIRNGKPGCHLASEGKLAWMMDRTKQQTSRTQRRQKVMTAEGKFLNKKF